MSSCPWKEEDFYILKNTKCAAVLTENFFMDNPTDMAYLMARKDVVVKVHVEGILDYVKSLKVWWRGIGCG